MLAVNLANPASAISSCPCNSSTCVESHSTTLSCALVFSLICRSMYLVANIFAMLAAFAGSSLSANTSNMELSGIFCTEIVFANLSIVKVRNWPFENSISGGCKTFGSDCLIISGSSQDGFGWNSGS